MMRVKFFQDMDYKRLEEQINRWLAQSSDIEIRFVKQSQEEGTSDYYGTALITIWYEERNA